MDQDNSNSSKKTYTEYQVQELVEKIKQNTNFLNKQDIEVLQHLSTKGLYCEKQVKLTKIK